MLDVVKYLVKFCKSNMLSFRNAKTVNLYVNQRVSENRAFMRKLFC